MSKRRGKNQGKKRRGQKEISSARDTATMMYTHLEASQRMAFMGMQISSEERMEALKEIIEIDADFPPALIDLGLLQAVSDPGIEGIQLIRKGVLKMDPEPTKTELFDLFSDICDNLERNFRYSDAIGFYEELIKKDIETPKCYDFIGYCHSKMGKLDQAIEMEQRALDLRPDDCKFNSNMGWTCLLKGELDKAMTFIDRAMEINPEDEYAQQNQRILKTMRKKSIKTWQDYLLLDLDEEYLEKLVENDDWEQYSKVIQTYNSYLREAFHSHLARRTELDCVQKRDINFSLEYFVNLLAESHEDREMVLNGIGSVSIKFEHIMARLICTTQDIDDEIFDGIIEAMTRFYEYLKEEGVISSLKCLEEEIEEYREELREKMHIYGKVRNAGDQEEKEELRDELFGDSWCFPMY